MSRRAEQRFDAILIGVGLAATACARILADAGLRVGIVEGVGRSRSLAADGGLIDQDLVSQAFDVPVDQVPLGPVIERWQRFRGDAATTLTVDAEERTAPRRAFRRGELESWALQLAVGRGATYVDGFIEGAVVPEPDGSLRLTSEDGERELSAWLIGLCEGSDPRIALRVGLRPDYGPEDQIHFAKTLIETVGGDLIDKRGSWRTSWGMPAEVAVIPVTDGAVLSVGVRIENIMRSHHSAVNALDELLEAPSARSLVPAGTRVATGVELVALRPSLRVARLSVDNLLMSVDASGMLDPRDPARADHALRAGTSLASHMVVQLAPEQGPQPGETWGTVAMRLVREFATQPGGYHDSRATGFLEESTNAERLTQPLRRLRDNVFTRLRGRQGASPGGGRGGQ